MGIPVDDVRLTIPASRRLITDERALPVGEEDVAGTEFDFRPSGVRSAPRGSTPASRASRPGPTAGSRAQLESPDGERGVEVWADEGVRLPPGLHGGHPRTRLLAAGRRVAIEPMTCPPNAFASGVDVDPARAGRFVVRRVWIALRRG